MKKLFAVLAIVSVLAVAARGGYPINGGPVAVTCTTNSGLVAASPPVYIAFPPTTVVIGGITNQATQCTNSFCYTLDTNQLHFVISVSSVFNATSNGVTGASIATPQSWTNTYPAALMQVSLSGLLQTAPQSTLSNLYNITSQ